MPSAVGQGALAVQIAVPKTKRASLVKRLVGGLTCPKALAEITAERALLDFLDGSCQTPISASATLDKKGYLTLDGMILRPDGSESYRKQNAALARSRLLQPKGYASVGAWRAVWRSAGRKNIWIEQRRWRRRRRRRHPVSHSKDPANVRVDRIFVRFAYAHQ